ncbi:hypothetical protein M9Y10_017178 [Tritrichomonas musculus]|uniref:Methyltransferase FkbM domain-containing protein n=1 Tax=Tritrichomonas musculus TaxID=1915356 RepID=A0ABR2HWB1_9EUKA
MLPLKMTIIFKQILEISVHKYEPWDKKSILFPSADFELADLDYHNITFSEYIYKHSDWISNEIRRTKRWCDCEHIYNIFNKFIKIKVKNMYAIDVGANIGACSLLLMSMGFKTIAFEPLPTNLHLLTRSLLHNPQFLPLISLYPIALGNNETKLTISYHNDNMGGSSALRIFKTGVKSITVPSCPLDSVLQNFSSPIIFAKIDVEGYEPYVIEGAESFLKNQQIKIIFYEKSCKSTEIDPNIFTRLNNLFDQYNYTSSSSLCRHPSDLFNILVISNKFIRENNIDQEKLIKTRF